MLERILVLILLSLSLDDVHAKLLNPNTSTYNLERETLAPDVKLELLLTAQDDLEKFAQEVKQVKDLEYVVSGTEFDGKKKKRKKRGIP